MTARCGRSSRSISTSPSRSSANGAYDRKSPLGTLDKALDEAKARGWTVVSMKDDWKAIYPPEK